MRGQQNIKKEEENNVVSSFRVIPWRLKFMCRSFGTPCLFFLHLQSNTKIYITVTCNSNKLIVYVGYFPYFLKVRHYLFCHSDSNGVWQSAVLRIWRQPNETLSGWRSWPSCADIWGQFVKMCTWQRLGDIFSIGHVTDYSRLRMLHIRRTYLRPAKIDFLLYFCSLCHFTRKTLT